METFNLIFKTVHILAGCIALLSGLGAILFRRKIKLHRPVGLIYFWSMSVIFFSSVYMSLFKSNYFLLFIGIFTYHSCLTALRALKLKDLHKGQKAELKDWLIEVLNIAANGGLLLLSAYLLTQGQIQWAIISASFGVLGIRFSLTNFRRFKGKVNGNRHWLITHIGGMLGSYIGAVTAFTVNNNRWMELPDLVAWLGPTVLLVPLISYEIARVKKAAKLSTIKI